MMESQEDLARRLIARLPIEEAEECLCQLEENLITVDVLSSADQKDLANELGFTARQCDAVLLDDMHWRAKYGLDHACAPDASSSEASKGERESGAPAAVAETGDQREREASGGGSGGSGGGMPKGQEISAGSSAAAMGSTMDAGVPPSSGLGLTCKPCTGGKVSETDGGAQPPPPRDMKSGLWQPGKLQVVTWRGTAKCSAAWKEALDEQTVAIDDIDDDGNTLLHMAAGQGHKLLVKELLRRCANPQVVNFGGKTCYDAAHQLNHWELGDYIREKLGLQKIGASLPPRESDPDVEQMRALVGERLSAMANQGKMSMLPSVLQGKFGSFQLFGRSLEERLGGMSDDPVSGLFSEHCLASDSDSEFVVPNHPDLPPSTPMREFAVVVGEDGVDTDTWTIRTSAEPTCEDGARLTGRKLFPIAYYMECQEAKRAKLTVSEMVALRLFTGPMYEKYNKVLRSVLDTDSAVSLEANSYSTTIGLIISGILKLSRIATAKRDKEGKVKAFRGLSGISLPAAFFKKDAQGFCGVVEAAFLSLTDDPTVALDYARLSSLAQDKEATIFELELGKASLGAEVAWVSQWPQEQERLLPPWTFLEVVQPPTRREDGLTVVKIKPTVFQNVRTVEEVSGARKEKFERT